MVEEFKKPIKEFSNSTRQDILYRLAKSSEDKLGRGFLIRYEVVNMLLARLGDECLRKRWGDKFEEKMIILKKLGSYVSNINFFLSKVDDEKFEDGKGLIDKRLLMARKIYVEAVNHLDVLYEAFYTLLDETTVLKKLSIPQEYFGEKVKKEKRPYDYYYKE